MAMIHLKLLFNKQAEEAARFYTDLYEKGRIIKVTRYSKDRNECVVCGINPADADYYRNKLIEGGDEHYRGESAWLVDKYGIWWQVITKELTDMMREIEHLEHSIKELEENDFISANEIKERRK